MFILLFAITCFANQETERLRLVNTALRNAVKALAVSETQVGSDEIKIGEYGEFTLYSFPTRDFGTCGEIMDEAECRSFAAENRREISLFSDYKSNAAPRGCYIYTVKGPYQNQVYYHPTGNHKECTRERQCLCKNIRNVYNQGMPWKVVSSGTPWWGHSKNWSNEWSNKGSTAINGVIWEKSYHGSDAVDNCRRECAGDCGYGINVSIGKPDYKDYMSVNPALYSLNPYDYPDSGLARLSCRCYSKEQTAQIFGVSEDAPYDYHRTPKNLEDSHLKEWGLYTIMPTNQFCLHGISRHG